RRNRAAVLTAAAVAAALLAGTAVATWQAVRATRAEAAAHTAAAAETRAKVDAEAREAETKAVLQFVEKHVITAAARPARQARGLSFAVTLHETLKAALPFVATSFRNEPLIEARMPLLLGAASASLGESGTAAEQFEAARALYARHRGPDHPDTLACMINLAHSYDALGQHADALRLHESTLTLLKARRGPDHPDTLTSMNNLALCYAALGRQGDALKLREQTLALRK